jgi:protoporphyrinogen oxidase
VKRYKYLILGAGPAGLSCAHTLRQLGEESFLVIEQEAVAGGLCRSVDVDGAPLDLGGGHFLDVKRTKVLELLFRFLPENEWQSFDRVSTINLKGQEIDYPLEANLWQLSLADQVEYLESIARAGCVCGLPMPESFEEWIVWKLGACIAADYMLPYNRKIWSDDLNELGTYWLHKLPNVSFRETVQSCLERKAAGSVPAHGVFLYPRRYGYGEVWKRMGAALGERLLVSTPVTSIDSDQRVVNGSFQADTIINTVPWTLWQKMADLPPVISALIARLAHVSIDVDYFPENLPTKAHWIYEPAETVSYHRLLCRHNFCEGSRGYWTETNARRAAEERGWRYRNEHAYPLNTREKQAAVAGICRWAEQNGIIALGRWGRWEHMNSDVAVEDGMALAHKLMDTRMRLS